MADKPQLRLFGNGWADCRLFPEMELELDALSYRYKFPIRSLDSHLLEGPLMSPLSFPLLHAGKGSVVLVKYPSAKYPSSWRFKVVVKLTHNVKIISLESLQHCFTPKRIECSYSFFDHDPDDKTPLKYSVTLSHRHGTELSDEIEYASDGIEYPYSSVSAVWDCRFVIDLRCVYDQAQIRMYMHENPILAVPVHLPESFTGKVLRLLESGEGSDVKIKFADGAEIAAHQLMLSTQSEVFKAMFAAQMHENQTGELTIEDLTHAEFLKFLHYVYTGALPVDTSVNDYLALLRAAHKYQVSDLLKCVSIALAMSLDLENVISVLIHADMYGLEALVDYGIHFIVIQGKAVSQSVLADLAGKPELSVKLMRALLDKA